MEDLIEIYKCIDEVDKKLEQETNAFMQKLRCLLHGQSVLPLTVTQSESDESTISSPQQTKKRLKCLSLVDEKDEHIKQSNNKLLEKSTGLLSSAKNKEEVKDDNLMESTTTISCKEADIEMPPPPPPVETHEFVRPQRAAKLKSVNLLKEAPLNTKLRRPNQEDELKIKKEDEQRKSQQILNATTTISQSKQSVASVKSSDSSILIMPEREASVVDLTAQTEQSTNAVPEEGTETKSERNSGNAGGKLKEPRVKIKREKLSLSSQNELRIEPNDDPAQTEKEAENKLINNEIVPKPIVVKVEPIESLPESANVTSTSSSSAAGAAPPVSHTKKSKKRKNIPHVPIKVERWSEFDVKQSPISSRTRNGSSSRVQRQGSVYEDALDQASAPIPSNNSAQETEEVTKKAETQPTLDSHVSKEESAQSGEKCNATMVIEAKDATFTANSALHNTFQVPNPQPTNNQATFIVDNPNATVTISAKDCGAPQADATFNVASERRSPSKDNQSMETAKDTSIAGGAGDSLVTEDESYKSPQAMLAPPALPVQTKTATSNRQPNSAKVYKLPTRTNELFNPLVQSPVKKKVEAFEAAAIQQTKSMRSKRTKENAVPTPPLKDNTTKVSNSKLGVPARFLTPTQSSNVTPNAAQTLAQAKKQSSSASKVMQFSKTLTSSLKSSASSSGSIKSNLSRENSADNFRRCLHQMAETRKKQREQKHLLAAQQREAKEKERAERIAKLAKEREEKSLRKQAEKGLEEIQRKLKQSEELNLLKHAQMQSAKSKVIQEQERAMLQQMKPPRPVAAPKVPSNYTFEMLHEDDSTDSEEKVTYKRPPPPAWSRRAVRAQAINLQQHFPTEIVDSLFSVQAMTPDLKLIFPNIDDRYLKRNSSAFWSTPPRYSELPKY